MDKLLADFIILGILGGVYLQYKGFKILKAVPASAERGNRALTRDESLRLVASVGYAFMGVWFEMLSISRAVFS
jgi:threonine/homoserine/homoserine lactone efflux protein